MKAIILVGQANRGKSTVIRKVINEMIKPGSGFVQISPKKNLFWNGITRTKKNKSVPDCSALFTYNGMNIAVISFGDTTRDVVNRFFCLKSKAPNQNIDLLICASRKKILCKIASLCGVQNFSSATVHDCTSSSVADAQRIANDVMAEIQIPFSNHRFDL